MADENTLVIPEETQQGIEAAIARAASKSERSFEDYMREAAVITGRTLVDKDDLVGKPFIITKITFNYGGLKADKTPRDFASIECVDVHSNALVFNDGSTGVRRQLVDHLAREGMLKKAWLDDPDLVIAGEADKGVPFELDPTLMAPRGLRVSEYSNEFAENARTFYLS